MEDMARLALVEQGVRDIDKFNNILYELLRQINKILANPHDYNLRTIKSECLKNFGNLKEFDEYLHYVGFEAVDGNYVYPSKHTLSNLRVAQAAIERKINYCFGNLDKNKVIVKSTSSFRVVKEQLSPVNVLTTKNPFLLKIQELFNNMLVYEDEELQELAREKVPLVTLQLMAVDRVREQQARIKRGEIKEQDMPFDIALLIELMLWFKHKFFSWVDKPACTSCGGETVANGITYMTNEVETCRVELYKCEACGGGARFPRHNDVRTLLSTRRGRCGEWANTFTLLARALRYDTRYVYDVSDHVWCEVFDYESNSWLHVDPCESKLDSPLMYSHGWGKRLAYVVAVARDDVQDVTWRYTVKHKEVLSRRSLVSEAELISSILMLRSARQASLSPLRRQYLAKRAALELVQLLRERAPGEAERGGRSSGAARWRRARGEAGGAPHCFTLDQPGLYQIRYHPSSDNYSVLLNGAPLKDAARSGWAAGVYCEQNMRRKEEKDWKKVYLAREDGAAAGSISWRVAGRGVALAELALAASSHTFHGASVDWTLQFDSDPPRPVHLAEGEVQFSRQFKCAELRARLAGGAGAARWQHAQLFRQDAADGAPALLLTVRAIPL